MFLMMFSSMVQISGENSKPFWSMHSGIVAKIHPSLEDEGLKHIGHIMIIENQILGVNSAMVSYLIRYDTLLQNATNIITKCDSYFITKCDRSLLQNAPGFLLQNATILLQSATVITKYDVYYKLRQYNVCCYRLFRVVTSVL